MASAQQFYRLVGHLDVNNADASSLSYNAQGHTPATTLNLCLW